MPPLKIQVLGEDNSWIDVKSLYVGDRPGSLSDNRVTSGSDIVNRELFLFGLNDVGIGYVKRSEVWAEFANKAQRTANSFGFITVAMIYPGNYLEILLTPDGADESRYVKFTNL